MTAPPYLGTTPAVPLTAASVAAASTRTPLYAWSRVVQYTSNASPGSRERSA